MRVHGRWRTERVPLLPHTLRASTKRIPFGARTTISGWLGTSQGVALGSQTVRILTTPDNGQAAFSQATVATTAADGSWIARLPAGPSRIIEAVYSGAPTVEPSAAQARVIVPGSVLFNIRPRHAHWGGKITLTGQLRGQHLPPAGETVILSVYFAGRAHDFAHLNVGGNGTFHYTYSFLPGNGDASYPFSAETVRESDYPYAPASSRKITVDVSPSTAILNTFTLVWALTYITNARSSSSS